MIFTWLQIEIQNGSGVPVAIGVVGDITIRNDSGLPVNILNGMNPGAPGVTNVGLATTQVADVNRTPNVDLIVQVARYEYDDNPPPCPPGCLLITIPVRTVLSNANLTQLGATLPQGTKPTFSVAPNGVINTISLI